MDKLSKEEKDLLDLVGEDGEFRLLFFQEAKGLKWFDRLDGEGYFNADKLPPPVPAQEEGYFTIPSWEVSGYLLRTAEELAEPSASGYVSRFLKIIDQVTTYAKKSGITNYRVWRHFAEILSQIPAQQIEVKDLDVVDYWLDDSFSNALVADIIGLKWLPKLLESDDARSLELAYRLLEILFKTSFLLENSDGEHKVARFRFDDYWAAKIVDKIAYLAGQKLKEKAVGLLQSRLKKVLDKLENDTWSYLWCLAVENHQSNRLNEEPSIILMAYRDALCGYIDQCLNKACKFIQKLLDDPNQYQTIVRVAIYCIGKNFQHCQKFFAEELIKDKYFQNNYRHEFWHFLNQNYSLFTYSQKEAVLKIIQEKVRTDKNGSVSDTASAYERAIWLAAIQSFGEEESKRYKEAINIAGAEPKHPDFVISWEVSQRQLKSPYSVEELSSLSSIELFQTLVNYKDKGSWQEPSIEGLTDTVKQLFKKEPLKYYDCLADFENLDPAYICYIIEAYRELWIEKANLPWDELWKHLLDFIQEIVARDQFWDPKNAETQQAFVANRRRAVVSIARLLESGARSDDHAYPDQYHDTVKDILKVLLDKEKGIKDFYATGGAVSISINSPRGKCIEALISLSLRECRIEEKANNGDHSAAWERYRGYFEHEFERAEKGEFEFITLVTMYLSNFLYMAKEWVLNKRPEIFDHSSPLKWFCAMQGYTHAGAVSREIYYYLRDHGDFLYALNDEKTNYQVKGQGMQMLDNLMHNDAELKKRVKKRVIENIVVAYLNDFETLYEENSLINILLIREQFDELMYLVWFIWTCCKDGDKKLKAKVYELWTLLIDKFDLSKREHRKLASQLCHWASFIEHIDEEKKNWLKKIAPYAEENYNSYLFLENIARLSKEQPFEANEIWQAMLEHSVPAYPEEAMREILENLVDKGDLGKRVAEETVNLYLKKGFKAPFDLLKKITSSTKTLKSSDKNS